MKVKITDDFTFEEFENQIERKSKNNIVKEVEKEIKYFEEKYEIASGEFYVKYNNGKIYDEGIELQEDEWDDWYSSIIVYSEYKDIRPKRISFINS